ncbi:MAG: universal stress protein [Parafilimonas sp.]
MQPIIVPTNFSSNSYNAARYAIALAADLKATKIILYNAYQPFLSEDPEIDTMFLQDVTEFKKISEEGLIKMQKALQDLVPASIQLEYESDYNLITNGIINACKNHNAKLIIVSITGTESKLEEVIVGSNAVDISKLSETPVLIVPPAAEYSGMQKILWAVDFKKVAETTPVTEIKNLLDSTRAHLDVLHVETNANETENSFSNEKQIFDSLFSIYNPQYHFLKGENFIDVINRFAVENKSDLIIAIPKKHGLFEGIFSRSHTKALAFHSHIPIMTIHE